MPNFNDTVPAAAAGGANVKWQKDGSGNVSAYFLKGAAQTPWLQDIDAAGYSLKNAGHIQSALDYPHAWNLEKSTGNWRYVATGPGAYIQHAAADGLFRVAVAASGAAGALASPADVATFGATEVRVLNRLAMANANGERIRVYGSAGAVNCAIGIEANCLWQQAEINSSFRWYQGVAPDAGASAAMELTTAGILKLKNQSGERIRVYDNGGLNHSVGIEASCMYHLVGSGSVFRWYCGVTPDNGATARLEIAPTYIKTIAPVVMFNMPTSASGLPSGSLWRDAAAGNVVKIVI